MRKTILCILIAFAVYMFALAVFVGNRVPDAEIVYTDAVPTIAPTAVPTAETIQNVSKEIVITDYSAYEDSETERVLWELCNRYAPNEYAAAAAMGMFFRESHYKSNVLCGWGHIRFENPTICEDFTALIDAGLEDGSSYDYFFQEVKFHYGGFGLCTWCSERYLKELYAYAQAWGTSISDAEMQCAFLFYDIEHNNPDLWQELINAPSPQIAGERMGQMYDHTFEYDAIGSFANDIYRRQHEQSFADN